jgi:hypothetical protein
MLPYHWNDISQMVNENYAHEYEPNDLLIMAVHHHHSIEKIKSENPGHGKVIIYQLEPLNKSHWWSEDHIIPILKDADEVWDYDLDNIKKLKSHGIDAKFKPFLYAEGLKRIKNSSEPDIDILFYGTLSDYRYKFLENINHYGNLGTTVCAFALTEEILDEFIGRSKIIIDLQLNDKEKFIQKQTRLYYALINNKCVLSEKSSRNYYGDLILEADNNIDDVLNQATFLLTTEKWKDYSNNSERFKQMTIANMIDNATSNTDSKSNIAIFYHLYQINDWKKLYQEQINSLIISGLYEKCDFIHIGINGDQELPFVLNKMRITYNENKILEANTLNSLWDFCNENPDYKVLYIHSKGVTHLNNVHCEYTTNAWRIYLEYFVINKWEECAQDLNEYDCAGTEWKDYSLLQDQNTQEYVKEPNSHYAGNFWWANASYIQKLDLDYIYNEKDERGRYRSEFWIGTKNPNYKSYHNSGKEYLYDFNYSPDYYMEDKKINLIEEHSMNKITLTDIVEKYDINGDDKDGGTDKNTSHSYFDVYEELLSPYKDKKGSILEIGVYRGGSLLLWSDYFKNFEICGLEVIDRVGDKVRNSLDSNRVNFSLIDAYNTDCITFLNEKYENGFDVIIDDGPHTLETQLTFIELYLDILKPDGVLIIEDVQRIEDVSEFISKIPNSDVFDYEYIPYDLRNVKGRYDDILFVIKKTTKKLSKESSKVFIVTPCTRPLNLQKISQSIPQECEWVVVLDAKVNHDHQIDNAHVVKSPLSNFRGYPNKSFGLDYIKNELNPSDNDWVYILHDDNIIHPQWYNSIKEELNSTHSVVTWGQCFHDETSRLSPVQFPQVGNIDTSQYMVRWNVAKNLRFEQVYEADGIYAEQASKQGSVKKLDLHLAYYNYLRAHKPQQEIRTNICMISMFKNESKGIRRMLESVWRHIDFYVFQDNGSTDGTPEIVREFFADKNIPGFIYEVEEGWVGFGWNRDHLLQTTLRNDHGCDWIMKMDCDEYLEVDDDFDWSPFCNTDTESFNVTAKAPGCIYYRTWIWNAKLPWKFKHDVAHECIYLDNGRGEGYHSESLPRGLRMIGTSDGESYTVRTKYISDALKLEEKLIREETMLTDLYHFWYTAKSYHDCYAGDFYPLSRDHSEEFARRFIFYYKKYLGVINAQGIHEMSYFSTFAIGEGYEYLGDYPEAIRWYQDAEKYCPERNEHIVNLARLYDKLGQHEKMLEQTTRLMDSSRKLPFPQYCFLLNDNIYSDSSEYPKYLHDYALSKVSEEKTINSFSVNIQTKPRLWIVDDFYADPHAVREFALKQEFEANINYYKGSRSVNQYDIPGTKEAFEKILGFKIKNWTESHGMCGRFQYCTAEDALVYHCDGQTWAGMVYLTPDAPYSCGTSLFAHKKTGLRNENDFAEAENDVFSETGFYDRSKFELVDTAGNVFNRLVLFDAKSIHAANEYFGTTKENSRLFHLFFFD